MKTFLFIFLATSFAAWGSPYGLVDLEALEKDKAYGEFFAHALDVRPSERTEYWKTMVQNMGESYLKTLLVKNRLERSDFEHMEELTAWGVLREHEFYRFKRQELGMRWLTQCLKENAEASSPCWQDLVKFWEADRQEADLAGRLLNLLSPYLALSVPDEANPLHRARASVNPYFILSPVIKTPLSELHCRKPVVQEVVWQELMKKWGLNATNKSFTTLMRETAHGDCWPSMRPYAHSFWENGADSSNLMLAYLVLKSQKDLSKRELDLFYLTYLLGSPAQGEMFNLAWNHVQQLGEKPHEREAILNALKKWRPLPGELFQDLDTLKRKTVARHIQRHFPEYLDYYAHTCVDYFAGKRSFPDGNPALHCRDLFNLAGSEKELLPAALIQTFNKSI